jgi:hypothetical protein
MDLAARERIAYLGTHWASRGYVSVYIEHLSSDESICAVNVSRKHLKKAYENPATMQTVTGQTSINWFR